MPDWSPAGTKIAFYTTRYDENTSDIAVINPDGSNVRRLTYTTGLPGDEKFFSESYPEWSPSGRRIAYQLYTNLYTVRADGTGVKKLTNADDDFFSQEGSSCPAWSPDGKKIAFCGTRMIGIDPVLGEDIYERGIYLINSDGTGEKKIPGPDHVTALDWQRLPAQ